jgi:hypothetical protein
MATFLVIIAVEDRRIDFWTFGQEQSGDASRS